MPERTRFASDAEFASWLEKVLAQSWIETDVSVGATSHVLTCCTCARTPGAFDMRAVFAVLEEV